jgi:hypothetical protein
MGTPLHPMQASAIGAARSIAATTSITQHALPEIELRHMSRPPRRRKNTPEAGTRQAFSMARLMY